MVENKIIEDRSLLFLLSMAYFTICSIVRTFLNFKNMVEYILILG